MGDLVRFGVSMEADLLADFDRLIEDKGYTNRSEALRDLVRDVLVQADWSAPKGEQAATLTIVYNHHVGEINDRLTDMQHDFHDLIVCTTHVHLTAHTCLEVIVLRGQPEELRAMAQVYLRFGLENPAQYRIMFGHILTDKQRTRSLETTARSTFGQLLNTLERGQQVGLIRAGSPLAFAKAAWSMVHGLVSLLIDGQLQTADAKHGLPTLTTAGRRKPSVDVQKDLDFAIQTLANGMFMSRDSRRDGRGQPTSSS